MSRKRKQIADIIDNFVGGLVMSEKKWRDNIRKVVPYVPGEQPKVEGKLIKLNTNENPYPPSPFAKRTAEQMDVEKYRLYPDPAASKLVSALASEYGVKNEQVFVGVGSDDVIAMSFLTFFNSDKPILFPDVSYSFYEVWADLFHIPYERPMLDDSFNIKPEDYMKENGGIIFPNPNAPTGIYMELDSVKKILNANRDVIVIVDEAYIDFGGESALSLIDEYDNLLVVRTFSKSRSMAGLRIGYAIGNEELIKALNDVKYSYNSYTMNMAAIELGAAVLEDKEYFDTTVAKIVDTREAAKIRLKELGFTFPDSKTNFIFAKPSKITAKQMFEELKKRNIYVRYFTGERVKEHLRITIGTDEEMERFFKAVEEIQGEI